MSIASAAIRPQEPLADFMGHIPGVKLRERGPQRLPIFLGMATGLHISVVLALIIFFFIFKLLGWSIPLLTPPDIKTRDIEFILVDNPTAPPRDPNTKNRADRATRSGGKRIKNQPIAESQRIAGAKASAPKKPSPARKPTPKRPTRQPSPKPVAQTPKPTPKRSPAPTPKPVPKKAPPRPTAPKPRVKPVTAKAPKVPSIRPPAIKTPSLPTPKAPSRGPIFRKPSRSTGRGSSRGGAGSPGPSRIPGSIASLPSSSSGGRAGSPGSRAGNNGRGSFNQNGSPGGGGGPSGVDALPEPDFGPYIAELQRRIKRNWNPPADNRNKRVVAVFTVSRSGRLVGIRIKKSSGVAVADQAATNAIRASAPFRPLPPNFRGNTIDVLFTFDYNVFNGGGGARVN